MTAASGEHEHFGKDRGPARKRGDQKNSHDALHNDGSVHDERDDGKIGGSHVRIVLIRKNGQSDRIVGGVGLQSGQNARIGLRGDAKLHINGSAAHLGRADGFFTAHDGLLENHGSAAQKLDAGLHGECIVKHGRTHELHLDGAHHNDGSAFEVHLALLETERAQKFRACALHVTQIIGVVHDAARVGVFPVDANRKRKDFFRD